MKAKPYKQEIINLLTRGVPNEEIIEKFSCELSYLHNLKSQLGLSNKVAEMTFTEIGSNLNITSRQAQRAYHKAMNKMGKHMELMGVDKECLDIFNEYREFNDW